MMNLIGVLFESMISILTKGKRKNERLSVKEKLRKSQSDRIVYGQAALSWSRQENAIISEVTVKHECARFPLTLRNDISDVPTFRQVFIHQEYNFSVKRPPIVVVDAGANVGLASVYLASK